MLTYQIDRCIHIMVTLFSPHGVAQVAMAVEMKSHRTGDLGFDSCATLPRNGVNNGHVKTRK